MLEMTNLTLNNSTLWDVPMNVPTEISVPLINHTNFSVLGLNVTEEELLMGRLGPRRRELPSVILLLIIYSVIFVTGTLGNICTCIVIAKNHYMQTTTNYYLFSLAISDVLTLLFGLPQEAYTIWEAYPYRFGEVFCIFRALLMEMTSYASILTITAFTVERYVAICHPLKAHKLADLRRSVKIIILIWIVSLLCALPFPIHTQSFYYITNPNTGAPILDSLQCNIPPKWQHRMRVMFQISTFIFFVLPMTAITVLYILIAVTLRKTTLNRAGSEESARGHTHTSHSMKVVLRMLIAVVVAFFACWAPFHTQRLLTLYNTNWTHLLLEIQSHFFYVSGVLYFVGSTVNPVLYNLISKRYREAFKETLCCCFVEQKHSGFRGSLFSNNGHQKNSIGHTPTRPRKLSRDWQETELEQRSVLQNGSLLAQTHHEQTNQQFIDPLTVHLLKDTHDNCDENRRNLSTKQCKNGNEIEHCPTCTGTQHNTMVTAPHNTQLLTGGRQDPPATRKTYINIDKTVCV